MNIRTTKILFIILVYIFSSVSLFAKDSSLGFYTFQTLTDQIASMPVADVMIPKGFCASISSEWDRLDGNYPGHESIAIENSDKTVGIYIFTNEFYSQFQNNNSFGINIPQNQGPDNERHITLLNYMDSASVIDSFMNKLNLTNRKLYKDMPIDNSIVQILRNDALKEAQTHFHKIQRFNMMK